LSEDNSNFIARLSNAQQADKTSRSIIESVESGSCNDYVLRNDIKILYKNYNDDVLFVVLKAMQLDIIKQIHEKGHFGIKKID